MQAGSFSSGDLLSSCSPEPLSLLCADERREIFITTKVPGGGAGVDNYKSTLFDAKVNLQLLKVDYVDRAHDQPRSPPPCSSDVAAVQYCWCTGRRWSAASARRSASSGARWRTFTPRSRPAP